MARQSSSKQTPSKAFSTPVRNTPVPRPQAASPARREITREMIAVRAYEIWLSGKGGTEQENWLRAERELRGA